MSRRIGTAALVWGVTILLSRVIGLVREAAIGRVLGGGAEADAYAAAFVIPDWMNYLLAGGALSIVFIPLFGSHLARGDHQRGWEAFSAIANVLLVLLSVATVATWFAVPSLSRWWFTFDDPEQMERLIALTRILLPAQVFHFVGALLSAALMARDHHVVPALAPLVYTLGIIAGGLIGGALGGPETGAYGFAWGVLAGSVLGPFTLPLVANLRLGLRWSPTLRFDHPDVKRYLWRSLPIMLAFSIVMWDDWLLKGLASGMGEGSVTTLQYAKSLMKVPMGVFGLAAGQAAYPTLTRLVAEGGLREAYETLAGAVRAVWGLALGAAVVFVAAGPEISAVLYGGRLPAEQHLAIGTALGLFCVGLWAWSAQSLVARGFYALGRTWLPSLLGTAVLVVCVPVYLALAPWGTAGLATASSIAISLYTATLLVALRRTYPEGRDGFGGFVLRALAPVGAALVVGSGLRASVDLSGLLPGLMGLVLHGAVVGGLAGLAYAAVGTAVGLDGLDRLWAALRRRIPVPGP